MILGLIPYFSLILLFFTIPLKDNREKFLYALVIWGVYIFCVTELLSFFHFITFSAILISWILFILACCIVFFLNKNKINRFPKFRHNIALYLVLATIILSTLPLITGLIYPPNNWDSMTYHLPRIEHWIQNQSLAMYPTTIERQNASSPFAEMILLHLRILSGTDIFYNSLQWFSYASCIVLSSFIAKMLGAEIKGQIFTALFCVSISMAILQASTTQTDLAVSLWLISALSFLLLWYEKNSLFSALLFGCSIGLACLTKGTAFAYGLPMVLFFGFYSLFHAKERFLYACCAGLCAFLILVPFSIRNYLYVQDIFGGPAMRITSLQSHSPNYILANLFCMIFVNFDCGNSFIHTKISEIAAWVFSILDIDYKILFPHFGKFTQRYTYHIHEDIVLNYFHFILILISLCFIKKYTKIQRNYLYLFISMFIVFSVAVNWQLWISRLLTPFFILYAPIMGILFERTKITYYLLIMAFITNTIYINRENTATPLKKHFISNMLKERKQNYFNNNQSLRESYLSAVNTLLKYDKIGLIIGGDSWEYPLWALLHSNGWQGKIIHITKQEDIHNCDVIVMLGIKEKFGIMHQGNPMEVYVHEINS